jgi:hypothetical protein
VWAGDFAGIRGRHLHPTDTGGTLVSLDQPTPAGSWRWGGPDWEERAGELNAESVVRSISGVTVAADDPDAMLARWRELGIAVDARFTPAGTRGAGLDAVDLVAVDRSRSGERHAIGGVTFALV